MRLHFAEVDGAAPGERVFDVALQGKNVLAGFDIAREAGGPNHALVKKLRGVEASDQLVIDLVPRGEPGVAGRFPTLNRVEVVAED